MSAFVASTEPRPPIVPRSEPQASGDIHEARGRASNQLRLPIVPRSEPTASGEVHKARVRISNRPRPPHPA